MGKKNKINLNYILSLILGISLIVLISALPSLNSGIKGYLNEDQSPAYTYNFSQNVTGTYVSPLIFSIYGINSSQHSFPNVSDYFWITINSSTGIMAINSTLNNQTGQFNISISVYDSSQPSEGSSVTTSFSVNATNDAPVFTSINDEYNLTQDSVFIRYLNATDEESQYPLYFNISFLTNCTHAGWSTRTNCTLFSPANISNISAIMNFTPVRNDVGIYYANISVMDFGNKSSYGCPHQYCDNSTYNQNKTTFYSKIILLNIFSSGISINESNCQNKIFQENSSGTCIINITTYGEGDSINLSSIASLRISQSGTIKNSSWFFANNITSSVNYSRSVLINVTPQKTEVGNWSINFTVKDMDSGQNSSVIIYSYVNRTIHSSPILANISNKNTSINLLTRINITAYDDDFLVPDKINGYNETIIFSYKILNKSNLAQELTLSNFSIQILNMPVSGTNRSESKIEFTPNSSDSGEYTINLTINDSENLISSKMFNFTILANNYPAWNESMQENFSINEEANFYLNFSQNVSDQDGNTITFSFRNYTSFSSFSINSTTGAVNFTAIDEDVGYHLVNITISDGYLTSSKAFNFTIINVNDNLSIQDLEITNATPSTIQNGGNLNATEDKYTTITLWIHDDDVKIPSFQKAFYNESFTLNLTIHGANIKLFNFTKTDSFPDANYPNRTEYSASFSPNKSDIGFYNVTINVTDNSSYSSVFNFNLTVQEVQHPPAITEIGNLTYSIIETIYFDINSTDVEDINETAAGTNLTYSIKNMTAGGNFLTINSSTGIVNLSLSQPNSGAWQYNISVNDSSGLSDSFVIGITIYDYPKVIFPLAAYNFSMTENVSSMMNFSINHTIQTNLTYRLVINGVSRNTTTGYGNGNNFLWYFTPNFTDETICNENSIVNITLNISNEKLSNSTTWNIAINHTNYPLEITGNIGQQTGGRSKILTLSDYFRDYDASDCNNQTIGFKYNLINSSDSITILITNWTNGTTPLINFTHPSTGTLRGNYSITAFEYNGSLYSAEILKNITTNNFTLELSVDVVETPVSSSGSSGSGGGASNTKPISLKILMPGQTSAKRGEKLVLPVYVMNTGEVDLSNIILVATISKDGALRKDIIASFDNSVIPSLKSNAEKNLTMIIDMNTQERGLYEITINATVMSPKYSDWGKFYINVEEVEGLKEKLVFTENFISGNAECAEIAEIVKEANNYFEAGKYEIANSKMEEAMNSCKKAIEQKPLISSVKNNVEKYFVDYVWIASIVLFIVGFSYHSYKRRRIKIEGLIETEGVQGKI